MAQLTKPKGLNLGGIVSIEICPARLVQEIMPVDDWTVTDQVVFESGGQWDNVYFSADSGSAEVIPEDVDGIPIYKATIQASFPGDSEAKTKQLNDWKAEKYFIVRVKDGSGQRRLYGTMELPMVFGFGFGTGAALKGKRASSLRWAQTLEEFPPAIPLPPTGEPPAPED